MADIQTLLNQAIQTPGTVKPAVPTLAPADAYRAMVGGATQAGMASAGPSEIEARTMTPFDLYMKYGDAAEGFMNQRADAERAVAFDASTPARAPGQLAWDLGSDVGLGAANMVTGLGALGAGLVSPAAGAWASRQIDSMNQAIQGTQSDTLQARRRLLDAQNALDIRDNTAQFEQDQKTDSPLMASLKRIGRDTIDSIANAAMDPTTLSSGVAQGVGSMLPIGPASKVIQAGARIAKDTRAASAVTSTVIGAMTAGGSYQQASNEVQKMSHDELMKNSPTYRELISSGSTPEEAKLQVANNSALLAAAIAAPLSAAAGTLVSRFEGQPFRAVTARVAAGNVVRETLEEGSQSGFERLGQNIGIQQNADENRALSAGVGEQVGQGALYGMGTAAAIQSPSLFKQGAQSTVRGATSAFNAGIAAVENRGKAVQAANEAASPVAPEKTRAAQDELNATAPQDIATVQAEMAAVDLPDAEKLAAQKYTDALLKVNEITNEDRSSVRAGTAVQEIYAASTDRLDALNKMVGRISTTDPKDQETILSLALHLYNQFNDYADVFEMGKAVTGIPEKGAVNQIIGKYEQVLTMIGANPKVAQSIGMAQKLIDDMNASKSIPAVSESELSTPKGQAAVETNIAVATLAPEKADLQNLDLIVKHAAEGKIQLPEKQRLAIENARALLRAAKAYNDEAQRLGLTPADIVTKEITTQENTAQKLPSGLAHATQIKNAYRAGDMEEAKQLMTEAVQFAQHMQNKVAALNEHLFNGNSDPSKSVKYESLMPDREWKESKNGLGVSPAKPASVKFAQTVNLEAKFMTDLVNNLIDAFPGLGVPKMGYTELDALLMNGSATEVAKEFATGVRTLEPKKQEPVAQKVEEPAPVQQPKVEPTPEPVRVVETEPEVSAPIEAAPVVNTTFTNDIRVSQLSDADLNSELEALQETSYDNLNAKDQARFDSLDAEMTKREDKAIAEAKAQETKVEPGAAEPAPVVTPEPEAAPVETEPAKQGIEAVFPSLVQPKSGNKFLTAFSVPKTQRSNLLGTGSPFEFVKNALTGASTDSAVIREYRKLLSAVGSVQDMVFKNLKGYLTSRYSKSNPKSLESVFQEQGELNRTVRGRLLNILEEAPNGFSYNQELIEGAVLAGMHWAVNFNQYGRIMDMEAVQDYAGLGRGTDAPALMVRINAGTVSPDALSSLAAKINEYWGLSANKTADIGYTDGIPKAMAAEVMRALRDTGILLEDSFWVDPFGNIDPTEDDRFKQFDVFKLNPDWKLIQEGSSIHDDPSLLDSIISVDPEPTGVSVGKPITKVPDTQLRRPMVPNTQEQKQALAAEQKTPFKLNTNVFNLYRSMGLNSVLQIFGEGNLDNRVMNVNHRKSAEGRNRNIAAAFDELMRLHQNIASHAGADGVSVNEVPVHYAYNMTSVGRMQMLGRYNPQSNKLMREAVLPTRSVVDLSGSNPEHTDAFALALGQALGIKIHTMPVADVHAKLSKMFNGPLADVIEQMRDWLALNGDTEGEPTPMNEKLVTAIRDAFAAIGEKPTFVGLHALQEQARLSMATDRKSFTTNLYVEADGVTNGPVNAMVLMTIGKFTPEWVEKVAKGGLFIGEPTRTMNEHRSLVDNKDLYQTSTDFLKVNSEALRTYLGNTVPEVFDQLKQLRTLMSMFIKDIRMNPDGSLELDRGVAKNPLTITVYGSGAKGIAGNLVSAVMDEMYAKMSDAAQAMSDDSSLKFEQAMFGNTPEGIAKTKQFMSAFKSLLSNVALKSKKDQYFLKASEVVRRTSFDPAEFKLSAKEVEALVTNMQTLFVRPMREAIKETVGSELMLSVEAMQKATQIQSVFAKHAFQREIQNALDRKAKADPSWKRHEFLSQQELDGLYANIKHLVPFIQTGKQNFMLGAKLNISTGVETIASALNDEFRVSGSISGPGDAGVSAIPFMTIGMGDGMMMQGLSLEELEGNMKIFDGMNMPLTKIHEQSLKANGAVFNSWMGNPLRNVYNSYKEFLKVADIDRMGQEELLDLAPTLLGEYDLTEVGEVDANAIKQMIHAMGQRLSNFADSIDARHDVLKEVVLGVDHMASTGDTYAGPGTKEIKGTSAEKANALNDLLRTKIQATKDARKTVTEDIAPALEKVGRKLKSGVRQLSLTDVKNITKLVSLPAEQQQILDESIKALNGKGYRVFFGSAAEINAHAAETGATVPAEVSAGTLFGWTNVGTKTVYLLNPSSETMVHELIHAATLENLIAHYQGDDLGPQSKPIAAAIKNLELLSAQFMNLKDQIGQMSREVQDAYNNARAAIQGFSQNQSMDPAIAKAAALNEFMAWGLSNRKLIAVQQNVKANPLVTMVKDLYAAVKALIWGRRKAPVALDDMFSNLLFNTAVVMQGQPSTAAVATDLTAFQNAVYGNSDRITAIQNAFDEKVVSYLVGSKDVRIQSQRATVHSKAIMNAQMVAASFQANGFPMSMQESSVFQSIVAALATEASIDPTALARAQEMFAHVTKELKVESFLPAAQAADPAARYYAQQKYDAIVGNYLTTVDVKGRTSLLPAFLALATTNDEFRKVLADLPLPTAMKNANDSVDNILENIGNAAMDKLNARMGGAKKADKNVLDALDGLNSRIVDMAQDKQMFVDQVASTTGGYIDRANQLVVDGVERLSDAIIDKAKAIEQSTNSKTMRALATWSRLVASLATEKNGKKIAEGVISGANRVNMWEPLRTFLADLAGRTSTNAEVFDMIKAVRSQVQQDRQQFREVVPTLIAEKFSRQLTDGEWAALLRTTGKTDVMALRASKSVSEIQTILQDANKLASEIGGMETALKAVDPKNWNLLQSKMKQLANYMNTGVVGKNLLRNAESVSNLFDEQMVGKKSPYNSAQTIQQIDQLVSLYAFDALNQEDKNTVSSLVQDETEGMSFLMSYLEGQRADEVARASAGMARMNHFKGHITTSNAPGMALVVEEDSKYAELNSRSFIRVADYVPSSLERLSPPKGYYFAPVSGRAAFSQGIMQNVRSTGYGVDITTGLSVGSLSAGRITNRKAVAQLAKMLSRETGTGNLMPVRDENGVVTAFERSIDPLQLERVQPETHLAKLIGEWRGRQVEEEKGHIFNETLIKTLKAMYKRDLANSPTAKNEYINILDSAVLAKDPVLADAVKLMTPYTRDAIAQEFGDEFWVRKDMLNDAVGYRMASVGDAWTGNSRWSQEVNDTVKNLALGVMGNKAYQYLLNGEKFVQNFVQDVKVLIVVKSVVVPAVNFVANMYQMVARGIPLKSIATGIPRKTAEVNAYMKTRIRQVEAEADLRAAVGDPVAERKLRAEIQSITDSHKRLSIWPLIEAGEFSSISDAGISRDEILLSEGKFAEYVERLTDKLPGALKTAGRYALVTKDTALFQGMQKAVEYGDFLAKAILFDDLTQRKGMTQKEALGKVTEEYVNYDRLPGRFRGYLESVGLLWFYNFKIRSAKIAVSMVRNNPVHALLATIAPKPDVFGSVGLPINDNLFSVLADGRLGYSIGPGQGLGAMSLNPWVNLTN